MPTTKSAIKAARQSLHRQAVNNRTKDKYKKALRDFRKLLTAGSKTEADKAMSEAASQIDKAVKKHLVHKNKAARLKSRMAHALKKLS